MHGPYYCPPDINKGTALVYKGVWYRRSCGLYHVRLATSGEVTFTSPEGAKAYIDNLLNKEAVA